jgi:hypothetical protein
MSSTNNYLTVSSGHIDSLINYVLDVKPYHVKLSAIVEQYIFHDDVNVKIDEDDQLLAILGADISPKIGTPKIRARRSQSWYHDIMSDGSRTTWQVPLTSVNKFASHSSRSEFYAGIDNIRRPGRVDDDTQIPGIGNISTNRVFSNIRWDGPGITDVRQYKYRIERDPLYTPNLPADSNPYDATLHCQDTVDYFLSRGVYSFDVIQGSGAPLQRWKDRNVKDATAFPENEGTLLYADVTKPFATVTGITGGNYEEWTLTRVDNFGNSTIIVDPVTLASNPDDLNYVNVKGSISGDIGVTVLNGSFVNPIISFKMGPALDGITEMLVGNTITLTPHSRIVVAPTAPEESWSLIKTNPIAMVGVPTFAPGSARPANTTYPAIEVHTDSLGYTNVSTHWAINFNGDGTYTLQAINASGKLYGTNGLTINLADGCGYKDDYIQFTLIPSLDGYFAGDSFNFTVGDKVEHYLVYGSISGWQPNAVIGEWYWNGKIGLKIPKLEYFAHAYNSTILTSVDASNGDWKISVANGQIVKSVEFNNGIFYITGADSIVGTSTDGVTWTSDLTTIFPTQLNYLVTIGPNGTAGVGVQDPAVYAIDSTTGYPANPADYIHVAVDPSTGYPYLPLRPAIIWEKAVTHVNEDLNGFVQVANALTDPSNPSTLLSVTVVVGNSGTIISTVNGSGWATQSSGVTTNLNDITFGNSILVAVGEHGTILTSVNRIDWVQVPSNTVNHLSAVTYSATLGMFIAVGDRGTILRSLDGSTWANLSVFNDGTFSDIIFAAGKFVGVDNVDGWVSSSIDGYSWTRYRGRRLNSIAYGNGTFVGGGGTPYDLTNFVPLPLTAAYTPPAVIPAGINGPEIDPVPHSSAEPSFYTITFVSSTTATVVSNVYGQLAGLKIDTPWTDGRAAFKIPSMANGIPYQVGDVIHIYLAPMYSYTTDVGYDESEYWVHGYDAEVGECTVPLIFNQEIFPLYHSHGSVIFKNVTDRDKFIIDKAANDTFKFRIEGANLLFPELAPDSNDWIPITLKYYDRIANNVPVSAAEFSDLATYIEGYLGSNPDVKVFHILQPRYETSNRNASATIVLDSAFVSQYLKFGTNFSLMFLPDQSYGQKIRVKITENFRTYARVRLNFQDISSINIADEPIQYLDIIEDISLVDIVNAHIIEGGAASISTGGYDVLPYGATAYDDSTTGIVTGIVESPAGSGNYEYTGNDSDWVIINPTPGPSISITQSTGDVPNVDGDTAVQASTAIIEGLTIMERECPIDPDPTTGYDAYAYDSYPYDTDLDFVAAKFVLFFDMNVQTTGMVVTQAADEYMVVVQNRSYSGSPTISLEQLIANTLPSGEVVYTGTGVYDAPIPSSIVFPAMPQLTDANSFTFKTTLSVPFRLTLS